jgi:hypothetical protein
MIVKKGSTNVTTYFVLRLAATGVEATGLTIANVDLQYVRSGVAPSAKVDATALAATDTAHTDNFGIEIDATDQPGLYRFDWPDAAFATGVPEVILSVKCATVFTEHLRVELVGYDPTDGVRLGLTALPNAAADAAGGLPISDAGGLDLDSKLANTNEVTAARMGALTDWINGGRLDLILDIIAADTTTDIPALIATLQAFVDTEVGAIKTKTDFLPSATAGAAGGVFIAGTNAATAITTALTANIIGNITGNLSGSVGSVTGAVGSVTAGVTLANDAITAAATAADFGTEVASAVWDMDATGHQTAGTFGQAIGDPGADTTTIYGAVVTAAAGTHIAADIIAVKAQTAAIEVDTAEIGAAGAGLTNINLPNQTMDIIGNITGNLSGSVGSVTGLTNATIADQVWEEAIADHSGTVGSTAEQLAAAGAAGDPWATLLPGSYGAGEAGKIIGDNINATISSRATQTSVDDVPTNAELATSQAAADDATLAAIATLQTSVDDLPTNAELTTALGTADDAVLAAVADLPTNAELATALGTADDAVLAQVALVKVQTDKLTFTVANEVNANVQSINDTALIGDGDATPWGPA